MIQSKTRTNAQDITQAITLTLLFRSVGALIFGVLADRFGRKWTLVANLFIIAALELGSGFCNTYSEFLGVRSLFGIGMGGIWGQAASTGLENVPIEARGLLSGILQQGYAVGYLLAAVINLTVVPDSKYTWRSVYFIGAGLSVAAAIVRAFLPESTQFILAKERAAREKAEGTAPKGSKTKAFLREVGQMLKTNWLRWIWGVCLMTGEFLVCRAFRVCRSSLQVSTSSPTALRTCSPPTCSTARASTAPSRARLLSSPTVALLCKYRCLLILFCTHSKWWHCGWLYLPIRRSSVCVRITLKNP